MQRSLILGAKHPVAVEASAGVAATSPLPFDSLTCSHTMAA